MGSENQSFSKQVGVCFEKVTVPDPTRHHLMGNAFPNEWQSLRQRGIMPFFRSQCRIPERCCQNTGNLTARGIRIAQKCCHYFGGKIGVHEGGVTLGQNCCHLTAKTGVFDSTATPETVFAPMGVSFRPVLILTAPEMIVKRAELLSFSRDLFVCQGNG